MQKECSNCRNWSADIEELDGTGICSKRAIHGGLTNYKFTCGKHRFDILKLIKCKIFGKKEGGKMAIKSGREWKSLIYQDSHQYFSPRLEDDKHYEIINITYTKDNDMTIFNFKQVD